MAKKPVVKPTQELDQVETDLKPSEGRLTPEEMDIVDDFDADQGDLEALDGVVDKQTSVPAAKSKISTKLLIGAVLLIIGGGAALIGGPKLAPMLPAGMAPVADFLAPGQATARDQIAAMDAQFSTRIAALENTKVPDFGADLQNLSAQIDTRITDLSDQVAASDSGDIESRLSGVETQIAGLRASMDTLTTQLSGVTSGEASPELAGYQSIVDGLKAEIAALSSQQGLIDQRIDEVAVKTDRRVQEADAKIVEVQETAQSTVSNISRAKAISDISAAIESGADFTAALTTLTDGGVELPASLVDVAAGVPTLASLKSTFSGAAHAALKASIKDQANAGVTNKLMGFLKSQVTVRSLEPQDGTSTDAILSRIQGALDNDNLVDALAQADGLNDISKSAMADWLASATTRQSALYAVSALAGN
tara:strand:- start:57122 stop:58387 length:1266 start_codon:yes stop_codon:yes gene_type:complete